MSLTPTAEQAAIVDAFGTGKNLVVEAGAGSGKTSTLRMLGEADPGRRGIYIAYNKAIATDAAKSFPRNVRCATAHSLAYRAVGSRYRHRLNGPRVPARESARILGIREPLQVADDKVLAPNRLARIVMDTVGRFCHGAAPEPNRWHVPVLPGLDEADALAALQAAVVPLAQKAWADIVRVDGQLRFSHDAYLKIWAMSGPMLPADFVLLDEAQDANPVISGVVAGQDAQKILVGDRSQAIYGWRGATDAMETFDGDRYVLSQSFRFGPEIAAEANKWLTYLRAPLRLRGFAAVPSRLAEVGQPDAVLCRSNAQAITEIFGVIRAGRRAALVGGGQDMRQLAMAAVSLRAGLGCDHPELFAFTSWAEVQDYAANDSGGTDLQVAVKLIDQHGPDVIVDVLDRLVSEDDADVVLSTAHRAKGREWSTVRIASDFREPKKDPESNAEPTIPRGEAMLAYVAVTRAKLVLDRKGLAWIDRWVSA